MIGIRRQGRTAKAIAMAAVALFALAATGAPASAAITGKVKKACAGDYKRLCPSYKVGSAQLRACMEAKQFEISSGCVSALIDAGEVGRSQARR
jgi:hypothetical protein